MNNTDIRLVDASEEPLHRQLKRQIRAQVLNGARVSGEPLPSIRALARQQRVSVITVQRAYDDLEGESLIEARRGKGFFVREISAEDKARTAESRFGERITRAVAEAHADGLDADRLATVFERVVAKGER